MVPHEFTVFVALIDIITGGSDKQAYTKTATAFLVRFLLQMLSKLSCMPAQDPVHFGEGSQCSVSTSFWQWKQPKTRLRGDSVSKYRTLGNNYKFSWNVWGQEWFCMKSLNPESVLLFKDLRRTNDTRQDNRILASFYEQSTLSDRTSVYPVHSNIS